MNYPIFILAKDDQSVQMHTNEKDLNWYEEIDIQEGLYEGWDSLGVSIDLKFNKELNRPFVEYSQRSTGASLKNVLENYAKKYFKVDYSVEDNNSVDFYLRLEKEFGKEKIHYGKGLIFIGLLVSVLCLILFLIGKLVR